MQYRYKTILFEFQKDGLLGDRFINEENVEEQLNILGKSGWELINVSQVQDGLLAFLKKTFRSVQQSAPITQNQRTQPSKILPNKPPITPPMQKHVTPDRPDDPRPPANPFGDIKIE